MVLIVKLTKAKMRKRKIQRGKKGEWKEKGRNRGRERGREEGGTNSAAIKRYTGVCLWLEYGLVVRIYCFYS